MLVRKYSNYEDYINHQSEKTTNPEKRKKWLNEEWDLKVNGFKGVFEKFKNYFRPNMNCLCIGARTGQEVVALKELGIENVIGIDIVPHEPHVIKGDMHNLNFDDNSFDFIFTNVLDHSIYPKKMISEIERVLKVGGIFNVQIQIGINQDKYTEFIIDNPLHKVLPLIDMSYCLAAGRIDQNFAGMNFEMIFTKDAQLTALFQQHGSLQTIEVPDNYMKIWNDINLPTQLKKLDQNNIFDEDKRKEILNNLSRRAYYMTRLAEVTDSKNIAEVGTAEGWQYYSFGEYTREKENTKVYSCDIRDVRSFKYVKKYLDNENLVFVSGTSKEMSEHANNIDFFYIDGSHDRGAVLNDLKNLEKVQSKEKMPVWVFDDFDTRFGCFEDMLQILAASRNYKIHYVGLTASGNPSHQIILKGKFEINED